MTAFHPRHRVVALRCLLLLALLPLAACSSLTGPRENFTVYTLNPVIQPGTTPALDWQLLIDAPRASDLLDGQRIVVAPDGNQRQVYKGARWAEQVPVMIQSAWLRGFETDGRLPGAGRAGSGLRADLILASDLTDFQARYVDALPVVEIRVHARLIDPRDRRIRANRVFSASTPVASVEIGEVVAVFEQALAEITREVIDWTIYHGSTLRGTPVAERP